MLFSDSYFTISNASQGSFKDRGSKFLAFAFNVNSESEIKGHLLSLKKEHPSAVHHCYAWRLGADKVAYRVNDDGEPSSSAGKPIFSQILKNDLTNILIVVVRYFGGTLLGVGGLINAYQHAAADALVNAGIEERFIYFVYKIEFGFDDTNRVMRLLKEYNAKIISKDYTEMNTIVFQAKKQNAENLENKFRELYATKLQFLNQA